MSDRSFSSLLERSRPIVTGLMFAWLVLFFGQSAPGGTHSCGFAYTSDGTVTGSMNVLVEASALNLDDSSDFYDFGGIIALAACGGEFADPPDPNTNISASAFSSDCGAAGAEAMRSTRYVLSASFRSINLEIASHACYSVMVDQGNCPVDQRALSSLAVEALTCFPMQTGWHDWPATLCLEIPFTMTAAAKLEFESAFDVRFNVDTNEFMDPNCAGWGEFECPDPNGAQVNAAVFWEIVDQMGSPVAGETILASQCATAYSYYADGSEAIESGDYTLRVAYRSNPDVYLEATTGPSGPQTDSSRFAHFDAFSLRIEADAGLPCPDIDGDGNVGASDLSALLSAFGSMCGDQEYDARADFNCDGKVDVADLSHMMEYYGLPCD